MVRVTHVAHRGRGRLPPERPAAYLSWQSSSSLLVDGFSGDSKDSLGESGLECL